MSGRIGDRAVKIATEKGSVGHVRLLERRLTIAALHYLR